MHACCRLLEETKSKMTRQQCYISLKECIMRTTFKERRHSLVHIIYIKHHCRYTVLSKLHLQRVTVANPFPKELHLSNQLAPYTCTLKPNINTYKFIILIWLQVYAEFRNGFFKTGPKQATNTNSQQTQTGRGVQKVHKLPQDKVKFWGKGRRRKACLRPTCTHNYRSQFNPQKRYRI